MIAFFVFPNVRARKKMEAIAKGIRIEIKESEAKNLLGKQKFCSVNNLLPSPRSSSLILRMIGCAWNGLITNLFWKEYHWMADAVKNTTDYSV